MEMFDCNSCCDKGYVDSGNEVEDSDAEALSYVGTAAYEVLRKQHNLHHNKLWNVTSGVVVGEMHQTPLDGWSREVEYPESEHDDWFPKKMGEIMKKTEVWCDIMSLGPPDGQFLEMFQEALAVIAKRAIGKENPVVIRMMFGNIVGMPVNCNKIIKELTKDLWGETNIQLWVGAWRRGASWNHAKIIAVDGQYLHTGGHNLWDKHYLGSKPVHDLSMELAGRVAHDGHLYANEQWSFIEYKQETFCGQFVDKLPDGIPLLAKTRVTISEYPKGKISHYPPRYHRSLLPTSDPLEGEVPIITMGRYGTIDRYARPSDDAIIAMLGSAKTIVRLALQDLGPVCIPGTKIPLPGCVWPKRYLSVLGKAMYERGVDVEIALSNPGSIPGNLSATEACYGNGWSCVDVAAELIKSIRKQFPDADDGRLRSIVADNLRVCFVRQKRGQAYDDGTTIGMHAKHFVVDDVCTYIGSQNLYICDLAEWGVLIDQEAQTKKLMDEYWNPMWAASFTGEDCDVQSVMDGLDMDRDGEGATATYISEAQLEEAAKMQAGFGSGNTGFYGEDEDEDETSPNSPKKRKKKKKVASA